MKTLKLIKWLRWHLLCLILCFSQTLNAITAQARLLQKTPLKIGIITAVPGEYGNILSAMQNPICQVFGKRSYYRGMLHGIDTVLVASRIGKVAAAATVAHLILYDQVDFILFIGVAGAVDPALNLGDVVIANQLIQHDMDPRPFSALYTIPLLNIIKIDTDPLLNCIALQAVQTFLKQLPQALPPLALQEFDIQQPKAMQGLILTGDQVISDAHARNALKVNLPEALCVEMEGASIAQVCYEYEVPFIVIRTISDYANHKQVAIDIKKFVSKISGVYSTAIVKGIYEQIQQVYASENPK